MMRIVYISNSYIPSRRANSVQVMKMCTAVAQLGHEVTLITKLCLPRQEKSVVTDYKFYNVEPLFEIVKLPRPVTKGGGVVYSTNILSFLLKKKTEIDLLYCRNLFGAWCGTCLHIPTILELHGVSVVEGRWPQYLYRQIIRSQSFKRLVVISDSLKQDLVNGGHLPIAGDVVVAHDGANELSSGSLRSHIYWSSEKKPKLGYVGHLYPGKGMEIILPLARCLSAYEFHVIGGTEKDLKRWQQEQLPENLYLHGFVPQAELLQYYEQLDILLLPAQRVVEGATGQSNISRWMSPLKMFEYMALGKPIISSDLPVLREVLVDKRNALLASPDNLEEWVTAVQRLVEDPDLGYRLGMTAQQDLAAHYTWNVRTQKVLNGL